ncbi:MAG TPA: hypothetical protein PLZ86_01920 [bacterium]|nr:hypothetical protein [bacterium]
MSETTKVDGPGIANGVAGIVSGCCQIASSIANFVYQGRVMEAQARMQDNVYENQTQNAAIDRDIAKDNLHTQLEAIKITTEAKKELGKSAVYRQRAESQLKMEKVRKEEADKTQAAAKIAPEARKAIADFGRRSYAMGSPLRA